METNPQNPDLHRVSIKANKPRLLDQLSMALRSPYYSRRTEQTYRQWIGGISFFIMYAIPLKWRSRKAMPS